jgi:hypothetical protein
VYAVVVRRYIIALFQDEGYRKYLGWSAVAHTYNPSYSGVRHWEDRGPRLAPGKNMRPYLKNDQIEKGLEV